jgi:cytochrome P450
LFERCERRYGDFFTLRMAGFNPMVFTSDPEAIRTLFAADRDNRLPAGRTFVLKPIMGSRSVLLQEGEEHLRRRKLMLPAFHGERMRAYETLIATIADSEVASWPEDSEFALHPRFQALTLEVILAAVFGVVEGERADRLREHLRRLLEMTGSPSMMALGLFTRRIGRVGPMRRLDDLTAHIDALLAREITERRAAADLAEREDILSMLIAARFDDGTGMDDGEIRDQLMTLLLAGHETTATALAWTFDLLFRAPETMERVRRAVDEGDRDYLDAVGQEALRLRPVIPMIGRTLTKGARLGGWDLPPGTDVFPAIYLVHRRGDVYPEPLEFRPERFLDGETPGFAWIPFGGGTRRCLGAAFAHFEMRVVLTRVLAAVELEPTGSAPEKMVRRNVTLSPKRGTPARILSRRAAPAAPPVAAGA